MDICGREGGHILNTKITQHKMGSNFSLFQPLVDKLLLFPDTAVLYHRRRRWAAGGFSCKTHQKKNFIFLGRAFAGLDVWFHFQAISKLPPY